MNVFCAYLLSLPSQGEWIEITQRDRTDYERMSLSLRRIPILVLSSDSGNGWNDVQIQLASWSENSKQITINDSEHYLYWSHYDEVKTYIDEFIKVNIK